MSNKDRIELSFLGIYPEFPEMVSPIMNDSNLETMMNIISDNKNEVNIIMKVIEPLKEKRKRKEEEAVEFDSDGSVESFD